LGTNDNSFPGGSVGSDNMTKIAETEYDGGSVGNSHATTRTAFVENSTTDRRDTTYAYDYRGRAILVTNAQAPHSLMKYDNRGRTTTVAQYSSASGLSASSDPTSVSTNRVARGDTAFDARGRVYKTTRHEINQSTGASSSTLDSKTWYDAVGRTLKVQGTALAKTEYDRIGRTRRSFTLGKTDDSGYSDVDDVSGDTVMEEQHTTYDNLTGNVLCRATIWRHPNESTSTYGSLYTGTPGTSYAYGDVDGRISITAMYYDSIDRRIDTVDYGTAGLTASGGSWSRPGSAGTRSAIALRTTYDYTADGLVQDVIDPKGVRYHVEYDAARNRIVTILNFVNGTPSADTADDDQTIRYGYTNGLMTTMTADLSTDQVTTYTYGVTRGSLPASKVASNRLLQKVAYPDSASGSDVVSYAYNAQGQQYWVKDQAGNEITSYFDTAGRETSRRANAINGSFDDYVQRIDTAYLSRGLVDTVTQYDDISATTARDQVQYAYDGWGNLTSFTQDPDSIIGASGQASSAVSYTWSASTPSDGVNTLRMTTQVLPGSFTVTHNYGSGGSLSDKLSRLTTLTNSSVTLATYTYAGVGNVAHTVYDEPGVETGIFDSSATTYPDWDNFNRIKQNDWFRVGVTDSNSAYFDARISYDENSNITRVQEPLYVMNTTSKNVFDVAYTNDNLNRLTTADQGHWNGSSITDKTNRELWTLTQTGNWSSYIQDTNADASVNAAVPTDSNDNFLDISDARTFNAANEYTGSTRFIGTGSGSTSDDPDLTAPYDAVGNMVDDGASYLYTYDVFGRLVLVTDRASPTPNTIAEYRYNGLGYRIGWHYDADTDSDVDGSDPWYYLTYNERWQEVATTRAGDSNPKQRVVHNRAGLAGRGGSSYIDSVILTDTDSGGWTSAAGGTLSVRKYLLQNWRADVVATTIDNGDPYEYVRYSPYGVPTSYPAADANRDGTTNATDTTDMLTVLSGGGAAVVCHIDLNKDGLYPDTADIDYCNDEAALTSKRGGYNKVGTGSAGPSLRFAYAGYAWDPSIKQCHVRHRVYGPESGKWLTRDPAGYIDGPSLTRYGHSSPVNYVDPTGLTNWHCTKQCPAPTGMEDWVLNPEFNTTTRIWESPVIHVASSRRSYSVTRAETIDWNMLAALELNVTMGYDSVLLQTVTRGTWLTIRRTYDTGSELDTLPQISAVRASTSSPVGGYRFSCRWENDFPTIVTRMTGNMGGDKAELGKGGGWSSGIATDLNLLPPHPPVPGITSTTVYPLARGGIEAKKATFSGSVQLSAYFVGFSANFSVYTPSDIGDDSTTMIQPIDYSCICCAGRWGNGPIEYSGLAACTLGGSGCATRE
ncbi:MAG TPA: RHS repeat-associated core domain-containing protein, partial [Phycisphaerales bacterium]|nr:RHS repeat-associated core domain-containing protein [Phycisphaerales bacterium]